MHKFWREKKQIKGFKPCVSVFMCGCVDVYGYVTFFCSGRKESFKSDYTNYIHYTEISAMYRQQMSRYSDGYIDIYIDR